MDHVTYILIMYRCVIRFSFRRSASHVIQLFSLAFLIYALIVSRIRLYATSGRNGSTNPSADESIELAGVPASKWYARVPNGDAEPEHHVIGDDD